MTIAWLLFAGAAVAAVVYAVHRLALRMERNGWIYYRNARGSGSIGNALLNVQTFYEPQTRHLVEERFVQLRHNDDSGAPPFDPNDN